MNLVGRGFGQPNKVGQHLGGGLVGRCLVVIETRDRVRLDNDGFDFASRETLGYFSQLAQTEVPWSTRFVTKCSTQLACQMDRGASRRKERFPLHGHGGGDAGG